MHAQQSQTVCSLFIIVFPDLLLVRGKFCMSTGLSSHKLHSNENINRLCTLNIQTLQKSIDSKATVKCRPGFTCLCHVASPHFLSVPLCLVTWLHRSLWDPFSPCLTCVWETWDRQDVQILNCHRQTTSQPLASSATASDSLLLKCLPAVNVLSDSYPG